MSCLDPLIPFGPLGPLWTDGFRLMSSFEMAAQPGRVERASSYSLLVSFLVNEWSGALKVWNGLVSCRPSGLRG